MNDGFRTDMKTFLNYFDLNLPTAAFLTGWVLTMIFVPIGLWTVGESATPWMMLIAVVLQATSVFLLILPRWGWPKTLSTAVAIALMGWLLEAIGTATGYPFGAYSYTSRLQPQIAHVPLLIPLAWFMMLPVSWGIAYAIGQMARFSAVRFALLTAAAMTAWDLFLDPQMVHWEFWVWHNPGSFNYFGIPWLNYFGWLLGSAAMTAVIHIAIRPAWAHLPLRSLWLIYAITWFLETFGLLLFWGLVGPALIGGVVMGGFMILSARKIWLLPHPHPVPS